MGDTRCQALVETLRDLAARYPGDADPAMKYLRAVEPLLPVRDPAGIVAVAGAIAGFKKNYGQKKNWDEEDLTLARETLKDFKETLKPYAEICALSVARDDPFTRMALDFFTDLGTVFSALLDRYNAGKRRPGGLDFSDLIHYTYRLFCEHDRLVAEHFRDRYRYILVDEFQDTDPVQTTILKTILGDLVEEKEHLFIVGDPKQSIYLFRDADVTLFKRAREAIETDFGGKEVPLDVNFRSTPQVVGFVNAVFSVLMAEASRPWEFRYDPLTAHRQDEGSVELLLAPAGDDAVTAKRNEAAMVAQKVVDIVGRLPVYPDGEAPRPAEYGDVAILLERRTNLAYYERALRMCGIPYHVHSGLGFYARQEVFDLYNILCYLDNGLDDVALYGVLRSPYFGISDADLFRMAGAAPLRDRLHDYAAKHPASDVATAYALLETWAGLARRVPVPALLGRVLDDAGVYAVYGGMPDGEQCLANVEKFVGMAQAAGEISLAAWVAELKRCIEEEEKEGEAHLDPTATDTVGIMTVHAAKGLEFPVVIVPGLAEKPPSGARKIFIDDGLLMGVKIPDPAHEFEPGETPVYTLLKKEHDQKLMAERLRLFYVATTRARDHLVLSGVRPKEFGTPLPPSPTRIDWLCSAIGLSEEDVAAGGVEVGGVDLTITTALPKVEAEESGVAGLIVLPSGDLPSGGPAPVTVAEEERPYSVSEIERYLACPQDYEQGKNAARREGGHQPPGWATTKGLILHEVLRGRDPAAVCARYDVDDPEIVAACDQVYTRFMASPLMAGALADHCEVTFRARIGGVPFKGAIDRLVRTATGEWVLIDYKTGRVRAESVPAKVAEYAMQMVVYRDAAEAVLGQTVKPLLYFTHLDRFVPVEVAEEEVRERTGRAVRSIEEGRFAFVECEGCSREGECPGLRAHPQDATLITNPD